MRVLVTGGAGYIGSHVVRLLLAHGYEVSVLDDLSTGHRDAVDPRARFYLANLCARNATFEVFRQSEPEAVLHFASRALVGESVRNPRRYFHDNLVGAINLLDAMSFGSRAPIVFSSSCATYGLPRNGAPLCEDDPQLPINPYGDSKLCIERMLVAYARAYGLRYAILRYFNAAGAGPGLGERHDPETHLIPNLLRVARGPQPAVQIFGAGYPTPDGTCVRDYVHVLDLADAHLYALENLAAGKESIAVNLGTGQGHSVLEVLKAARRVTGDAIPAVIAPRRPGDPPRLVAAIGQARELLGWTPKRSDLQTMISSAWESMR